MPTKRFPLNPCDYLYYAYHVMMERRGQVGNTPFMTMELAGDVDPSRLQRAVEAALRVHPVFRSRAEIALLSGRPKWRVVERLDRPVVIAIDLRDAADWRERLDAACQAAFNDSWELFKSPQVRLELYRLPDSKARLCIRWPHAMMDAEGAIWFLSEINRMDERDGAIPAGEALTEPSHPSNPSRDREGAGGDSPPDTSRHLRNNAVSQTERNAPREHGIASSGQNTLTPALSLQGRGSVGPPTLSLQSSGSDGLPEGLRPDGDALDGLADCGPLRRVRLFRTGYRAYHHHGPINVGALADGPTTGGRWRFFHREWTGDEYARLRSLAAQACPDGPARMTRYLAACVLRALHALFTERGAALPAYLVTMPTRLRGLPDSRPVHGNYLVSATLHATPEMVTNRAALLADLAKQIDAFFTSDADKANWALIWFAGLLRHWQYRRLLALPIGLQPYASGFSSYGEIGPPLKSFVGAAVDNLWGCTSMNVPPGWNPAFSRFGERLNLSLAWLEGYYRRETAERYLELIEREMMAPA